MLIVIQDMGKENSKGQLDLAFLIALIFKPFSPQCVYVVDGVLASDTVVACW